ncbi:hypothetical protein C804_00972 [Lachnospiraceae bacterium A4]|nr:hypothetical protein C804_00972 [Lachnospiraceae bacterium A4]
MIEKVFSYPSAMQSIILIYRSSSPKFQRYAKVVFGRGSSGEQKE